MRVGRRRRAGADPGPGAPAQRPEAAGPGPELAQPGPELAQPGPELTQPGPEAQKPPVLARPARAVRRRVPAVPEPTAASAPVTRREREAGACHDEARYSCQCGFVFQASVSTSVGCPHCGATQAW